MRNAVARTLRRVADVLQKRSGGFDAAGKGDRWPTSSRIWSPVSQQLAAAGPVAQNASWLVNNSATAASFVETWITSLVGTGPTLRSGHPDAATRSDLERRWWRWCKKCDAEGTGDLAAFLAKAARTLVVTGDSFIQLPIVDRQLRLKLISSEQVWRPATSITGSGNRVISGVEVDSNGRRVAYHVLPEQPDLPWSMSPMPTRVPADELLHVFLSPFAGSVRGISWVTPIASRLLELDRLEDALLARMNVAALFAGFIRDVDGNSGLAADSTLNAQGKNELSMEPGSLRVLPPGTDITFPSNLPDIAASADFLKHILRSIAAGGGVPASLLTQDLGDVNYSSARLGLEQFKRSVARVQQAHLVAQLLQPIYERWLMVEVLSGRMPAPDYEARIEDYHDVEFRWAAWAPLDPLKEARARDFELKSRTRSRAEIIAANGRDVEDVDDEIERDAYPQAYDGSANIATTVEDAVDAAQT